MFSNLEKQDEYVSLGHVCLQSDLEKKKTNLRGRTILIHIILCNSGPVLHVRQYLVDLYLRSSSVRILYYMYSFFFYFFFKNPTSCCTCDRYALIPPPPPPAPLKGHESVLLRANTVCRRCHALCLCRDGNCLNAAGTRYAIDVLCLLLSLCRDAN